MDNNTEQDVQKEKESSTDKRDNGRLKERVDDIVDQAIDPDAFQELHWQGSFDDYLDLLEDNPFLARTSFQRLYDMILSYGVEEVERDGETIVRYPFFSDPINDGKNAVYGLEKSLMHFVNALKAGAHEYGTERRLLLLHGPVGSAKSTILTLLKRGLEKYSRTSEGALYTYAWKTDDAPSGWKTCPMHEEPLKLIPEPVREDILEDLNQRHDRGYDLNVEGDPCPECRYYYNQAMERYDGDWHKVVEDVRVERFLISEKDRDGIATFQPKDEKNQDSTELTGDINYRKIAKYGSDSDPRVFNFDGELNVANRGLIEFIEVLKLDVAFLYDLLGATQEHNIKPKKFAQTDIDEVIIGHTNEPEYRQLQNNDLMEAFRDRTVKIDIPYNLELDREIQIYERDYNNNKISDKHIAPHTIEVCSMWAVLSRLEEPKNANLTLMQKLKLYNGKSVPGFTGDSVTELREAAEHEGMEGISPRYIQNRISNALVTAGEEGCVNPFKVMNELDAGLDQHALITSDEEKERYRELLAVVKDEYEDIVKNEVQRAITADEEAVNRLFGKYIDNVKAYTRDEKVKNRYTGEEEEPDERMMRSIEEKVDIPESRKEDFRREIMNYIGAKAVEGKDFDYRTNERLQKALELKLFEDQKDSINLSRLVTDVVDQETQEKIDIVKSRLINSYGYCDVCANDVLSYVSSIFSREEEE
jgi:serine protein kinase